MEWVSWTVIHNHFVSCKSYSLGKLVVTHDHIQKQLGPAPSATHSVCHSNSLRQSLGQSHALTDHLFYLVYTIPGNQYMLV